MDLIGATPFEFHENKIYLQIADHLRGLISDGTLPVGSPFPSEDELAKTYGTARGTVQHARAVLVKEGLIEGRRGKRYIVIRRP